MSGLVEMRRGVLERAGITAADMTTGQTHTQVCPRMLAIGFAFLAASRGDGLRLYDAHRGLKMLT